MRGGVSTAAPASVDATTSTHTSSSTTSNRRINKLYFEQSGRVLFKELRVLKCMEMTAQQLRVELGALRDANR